MMKKFILLTSTVAGLSQAYAHNGSHQEFSFASIGQHLASSPYHLGLIIAAAIGLAIVIPKIIRSKSK